MLEAQSTTQRSHTTWRSVGDFRGEDVPLEDQNRAHESRKESRKILGTHPKGLRARIYLCILRFVGTISCERKVRVDGVRLTAAKPATNVVECLARHRISPGGPLANSPVRHRREELSVGETWCRGSLVWSDISSAPVQGGYEQ